MVVDATFSNNTEPCDICGLPSKVVDGNFDLTTDTVTVRSAPQWSIDALEAIGVIVEQLHETVSRPGLAPAEVLAETSSGLSRLANVPGAAHLVSEARRAIAKPKSKKRRAVIAIAVIAAMYNGIGNYGGFRDGLDRIIEDVRSAAEVVHNGEALPSHRLAPGVDSPTVDSSEV
jgi:hypothetical protein